MVLLLRILQHSVAYREMMTEMKNRYCPDLVIEHAINQNPYNGVRWLREARNDCSDPGTLVWSA